jgi:hypothetical protein
VTHDEDLLARALEVVCQELWDMYGFQREVDDEYVVGWALQTHDLELTYAYYRVRGCDDEEGSEGSPAYVRARCLQSGEERHP